MNDTEEYAIPGKMIRSTLIFNRFLLHNMADDDRVLAIKKQMAVQLAEKLISQKMIEFTYMNNVHDDNVTVNARVYVVPDDVVRIIRTKISPSKIENIP